MESEPYNNEFVCVTDDWVDEQVPDCEPHREKLKDQGNELVEANFAGKKEEPRPVFLSASLNTDMKQEILAPLLEFRDVFAWTYAEMLGLNLQLVTHKLSIKGGTKPVK